MNTIAPELNVSIIARMVLNAPGHKLGRTQLMKLCYFLQEIEQVPIQYDFRLFNYGPFDSEVLNDLGLACSRDAVVEKTVTYNRGYGYEITPGNKANEFSRELESSQPELAAKIDSVVAAFSGEGAGELELKSTIVFVDREFDRNHQATSIDEIASRVNSVKPHFDLTTICDRITQMEVNGYLISL